MPAEGSALEDRLRQAIRQRYGESRAAYYGISEEAFKEHIAAVVMRYGAECSAAERLELVASLHVEDLMLARACSDGNNAAWREFMERFRHPLHTIAKQIARDDAAGLELADGLYAELYGLPNREGQRASKLRYYMGRGSLQGWLRTVLAREYVDRCRSLAKDVSLEEQMEAGVGFAAKDETEPSTGDGRVAACVEQMLGAFSSEERFLLASYYCKIGARWRRSDGNSACMSRQSAASSTGSRSHCGRESGINYRRTAWTRGNPSRCWPSSM